MPRGRIRRPSRRPEPSRLEPCQRFGHLAGAELEHVAQDQHGALPRWQVLERGDERELDGLVLLVAGVDR